MQPPTFTQMPSTLVFGPPTDISMGWDGTLWAIDASGALSKDDFAWLVQGKQDLAQLEALKQAG
jgi:hypothetical protein